MKRSEDRHGDLERFVERVNLDEYPFYPVRIVADIFFLKPATIVKMIKAGKIAGCRPFNGKWLVPKAEVYRIALQAERECLPLQLRVKRLERYYLERRLKKVIAWHVAQKEQVGVTTPDMRDIEECKAAPRVAGPPTPSTNTQETA